MAYTYRGNHTAPTAGEPGQPGGAEPAEELSSADRIRDAAVELFGEHGFAGVSLKTIAERAGVSAPLVIHHYGSKAGLRQACDRYAAETIYRIKAESVERGENLGPQYVLAAVAETKPILRYLFQAFAAGGPEVDALLDRLIDDSLAYTEQAERQGLVRPSRNPRHRAAVMFLQSFGAMMLHAQMKRLIGTSLVDDPPEDWGPYFEVVLEIYRGVFEPGIYDHLGESLNSEHIKGHHTEGRHPEDQHGHEHREGTRREEWTDE